jgi:hypothetical protein
MKNNLKKYFSFLVVYVFISCGGGADDAGGGSGGGGGGGNVSTPPGKSTLLAPANNKACETGISVSETQSEVAFSWSASAKTSFYDLTITNLNTNTITNKTGITSTSTKSNLDKGIPYSWYITSKNNTSSSNTKSDTWKFYLEGPGIVNYAPFPAEIKEPNESLLVLGIEGVVKFIWEGSDPDADDTLTYTLFLDKVDGKQTPPSSQTNLTLDSLSVVLDKGATYFCRVKTSDGTNSSYSTIYSFKTQ